MAFWCCAIAILVLALVPGGSAMPSTGWDKANHLLAFFVLAVLGVMAYPSQTAWVIFGLLAYGVLIEAAQFFTPTRSADWRDIFANALGLALGWGVLLLKSSRHQIKISASPSKTTLKA